MSSALKTIVSKNKRRHLEDGFNLDLSYINERIIAMGFPAEKVESIYRNSLDEVKRFLEQKHADHYFIYNLCSERFYDSKKFHGRVATYPFDDHHPPDFASIKPFCDNVASWLSSDPSNVAVVHCKAGKGRTGVMICCYLLHSGRFQSAEEVLQFYGQQRTVDQKGVTIPSQRRYINYYSSVIRDHLEYKPVRLYLRSLVLDPVPNFNFKNMSEFYVQFDVRQQQANKSKFESADYLVRRSGRQVQLLLNPPLLICGDVKIEFSSKLKLDILPKSRSKEFHFWFNTFFVDSCFSSSLCHSVQVGPRGNSNGGGHDRLSANGGCSHHRTAQGRHSSCLDGAGFAAAASSSTTVIEEEAVSNLVKQASISDDHLPQRHHSVVAAAVVNAVVNASSSSNSSNSNFAASHQSFIEPRTRHFSVPQTTKSGGGGAGTALPQPAQTRSAQQSSFFSACPPLPLPPLPALPMSGAPVSLRLERAQIDKVAKDKSNKYADNFAVTLFMFRPDDQSDFSLSSCSSSNKASSGGGGGGSSSGSKSSPDSSSEEEEEAATFSSCSCNGNGSLPPPQSSSSVEDEELLLLLLPIRA